MFSTADRMKQLFIVYDFSCNTNIYYIKNIVVTSSLVNYELNIGYTLHNFENSCVYVSIYLQISTKKEEGELCRLIKLDKLVK